MCWTSPGYAELRIEGGGPATTPHETLHQAKGLDAQLVLIDGDRDDIIDVVTQARASGANRVIAVHAGKQTPATRDELSGVGADLSIRKAGRPGILNKAAELVGETDVPF